MHYIIFDLEATCWDKNQTVQQNTNETIEIGALKIGHNGSVMSEFSHFIKPMKHPVLSDFCKQLTSITQADVDNARQFYEVIEDFQKWISTDEKDYLLCSWGYYDRKQLENDSSIFNLDTAWLQKHISIKHQYADIKNLKRAVGMKTALEIEKIVLEGIHHRGIDDARNIAKIFIKYFGHWNETEFSMG